MTQDVNSTVLRKIGVRLIPFLSLLYFVAFLDRVNVGFAAAQMTRDLGFSATVFGLGAGIFFVGYCLFEVPSNLLLHRLGARRWIGRIMITWALIAAAMSFVTNASSFYTLRFALGAAEAGLFPGVVYYLTYWVPAADRAKVLGRFMTAIPISTALAGPLSSMILRLDGVNGLSGWQWLFLLETLPSLLLGCITLIYLPDKPTDAAWLSPQESRWLTLTLRKESAASQSAPALSVLTALTSPRVLLLSVCYLGAEIGLYGVIMWIPQIFAGVGFAPNVVGFVVSIPYLVAAAAMVWWSRRSDRQRKPIQHIAVASAVAFTGIASSAFLTDFPTLSVIAITAGAAGTLAILPIFWTLSSGVQRGAAAAGVIALINAIGHLGGFAGPFVIGWTKTASGSFTWGLVGVAMSVLSTGIIALLIGDAPQVSAHTKRLLRLDRTYDEH